MCLLKIFAFFTKKVSFSRSLIHILHMHERREEGVHPHTMHMFSFNAYVFVQGKWKANCGHTHRYLSYLTVAIKKFSLCNAIIFDIEDGSISDFKDASCILVHSTRKL